MTGAYEVSLAPWHDMPRIDRGALPDLDMLTGVFGSRSDTSRIAASDDNVAELMICLHPFHEEG